MGILRLSEYTSSSSSGSQVMDYYQQQGTESFGAAPGGGPKRQQRGPVCESDEHTELKEKVVIPLEKYPGYNFVGSLLGPQGSILKALQKGVNAKISIFGKGSMRDKEKEKELYTSEDPEHAGEHHVVVVVVVCLH